MELGIEAVALDREGALARDKAFERDGLDALIQLLECPGREARQQDHNAFAHAKPHVCARHVRKIAVKKDAAILHAHALQVHAAQLVADQPLQPEQAGDGKSKVFHE